MSEPSVLRIRGPNPGETIEIAPHASGKYRVQRHLVKQGTMAPILTVMPWTFAYTVDAAQQVLAWIARDHALPDTQAET